MEVEVVKKNLEGFQGEAWLVKFPKEVQILDWDDKPQLKTQYFVVSGANAMLTGWEVLVFPADEKGKVLDYGEVAGGRGITHEEAIQSLNEKYGKEAGR